MIDRVIVQVTLRRLWMTVSLGLLVAVLVLLARPLWAQKTQESFRDKFNIAEEAGGVAIATLVTRRQMQKLIVRMISSYLCALAPLREIFLYSR